MKYPIIMFALTFALAVLCFSTFSSAVGSFGQIFTVDQPDGSSIQVRVFGDEFYRDIESLDGYTLIRDPISQWICYATTSED